MCGFFINNIACTFLNISLDIFVSNSFFNFHSLFYPYLPPIKKEPTTRKGHWLKGSVIFNFNIV